MSFFKRIRGNAKESGNEMEVHSFTTRSGRSVKTDSVFKAWTSGSLDEMLSVLDVKTHFIDRHHLLQSIIMLTYKDRTAPDKKKLCKEISELHIVELQKSFRKIVKDVGVAPSVPTFKNYATILVEDKEFDRAIEVCRIAIKLGIPDGTMGGFEGRIERIKRKIGTGKT